MIVLGRGSGHGEFVGDDFKDCDTGTGHTQPLSPMSRLMCRVSVVTYVVNSDTLSSTVCVHIDFTLR